MWCTHLGRNLFFLASLVVPVYSQTEQLQGRFYGEPQTYMVGEPVLFSVDIKNAGPDSVYIHTQDSASCVDTYDFSVQKTGSAVCTARWDAACGDKPVLLKPGENEAGQWPLNYWFQFEGEGTYEVSATRHIPVMSMSGEHRDFTFSSKFSVKISPLDPARVEATLQDFEKKLYSTDPEVRHAALDVLASTSPDYFQDVALRVARSKDAFAVMHAIGALERINSPETRAALGDLLTTDEPKTEEEVMVRRNALQALGHCGDRGYESLIQRYLDDKNEGTQLIAMVAIAQLGRADAVSELEPFLFSANPVARKNVAWALSYSKFPEAVEVLISAIPDKDPAVRDRILASLTDLTGYSVGQAKAGNESVLGLKNRWDLWWRQNKKNVTFPDHLDFVCHLK